MTKTTAEKIAVMQAYERGEKIEYRNIGSMQRWLESANPKWSLGVIDYRIAAPDPVPHTIDWSHVSDDYVCMVTTSHGNHYLATSIPEDGIDTWHWPFDVVFSLIQSHSSFKPGNMPWQDSLVVRPVDAKK